MTQGQHDDQIIVGTSKDQGVVLVLVVVVVPAGELLVAVGCGINRIEVKDQAAWRHAKGGQELIDEDITQSFEGSNVDAVLEA